MGNSSKSNIKIFLSLALILVGTNSLFAQYHTRSFLIDNGEKLKFSTEKVETNYKTIIYLNGPDISKISRDTLFEDEIKEKVKKGNSRFILPNIIGGYSSFLDKFKNMQGAITEGEKYKLNFEFTVNEIGVIESVEFEPNTDYVTQNLVVEALSKVRFSPAIKDGRFVKVKLSHQLVLYK